MFITRSRGIRVWLMGRVSASHPLLSVWSCSRFTPLMTGTQSIEAIGVQIGLICPLER